MKRMLNPLFFVLAAVLLRLLPHVPNVTPIAAMALFGGVYLNKRYALLVPLLSMGISDIFLGFHNTMIFVYGSFVITGVLGLWLRKHKSIGNIFLITLSSSLLFYSITNFGVWLMGNLYPKTLEGLVLCYTAGIPFFRNTVMGDMLYVVLFFSAYELMSWWILTKRKAVA